MLKGKKILVTAVDLEQSEHRGIAKYSKSLISALASNGAEVWLLTQLDYEALVNARAGVNDLKSVSLHPLKSRLARLSSRRRSVALSSKKRLAFLLKQLPIVLQRIIGGLFLSFLRRRYTCAKEFVFCLDDHRKRYAYKQASLEYFKDLAGLVSLKRIFFTSQLAAFVPFAPPVYLECSQFDIVITTCPLYLAISENVQFVQSIHDLIALHYLPHGEDSFQFKRRLQACMPAKKLFVSNFTLQQFNSIFEDSEHYVSGPKMLQSRVLMQSPSLFLRYSEIVNYIENFSPVTQFRVNSTSLNSFQYILFNSSIEPRKNLEYLIEAYDASKLFYGSVRLCIVGKIHRNSYCNHIRSLAASVPGVLLTDYVVDEDRILLYLYSLGLISPSITEGFGIPVLDASCLGLPVVASRCDAHLELASFSDFSNYISFCDVNQVSSLARLIRALRSIEDQNQLGQVDIEAEARKRLTRYGSFFVKIQSLMSATVAEICV